MRVQEMTRGWETFNEGIDTFKEGVTSRGEDDAKNVGLNFYMVQMIHGEQREMSQMKNLIIHDLRCQIVYLQMKCSSYLLHLTN